MIKFRKKPELVEAFVWTGDNTQKEDPEWMIEKMRNGEAWVSSCKQTLRIDTLEGISTVHPGDYIIQGAQGEIYSCKPDIFKQTYEEVKENVKH